MTDYRKTLASGVLMVATQVVPPTKLLNWIYENKPPEDQERTVTLLKFWLEGWEQKRIKPERAAAMLGWWLVGVTGLTAANGLEWTSTALPKKGARHGADR